MKRREFIAKSTTGTLGIGLAGCSTGGPKKRPLYRDLSPFTPRPRGGTMPMAELGNTGMKISRLTFGSHIRAEMTDKYHEREYMIHEAYDLGVNVFDVYDEEKGSSKEPCMQYEPLGRQIAPFKNDVFVSISFRPYDGRTPDQELERDLRLFGKDCIDLCRILRPPENPIWETLFRYKEKGYIRAIGAPVHDMENIDMLLGKVPLDYILMPYNFYHSICWLGDEPNEYDSVPAQIRQYGIEVFTMKPFGGDYLVKPFINFARDFTSEPEITFPQASLRYILNSGIDAKTTFTGMYNLSDLYENVAAFYHPKISHEESELLKNIKDTAVNQPRVVSSLLPDHYKFLENWVPNRDNNQTLDTA